MLPFFSPLAEDTLEHPLPKERRFNACFFNSFSSGNTGASFTKGKEIHCFLSSGNTGASFTKGKEIQCFLSYILAEETLEHPLPKERRFNASFLNSFSRGYTGASFTKGKEIHCFLSSGNTGASFTKGKEIQCFLS